MRICLRRREFMAALGGAAIWPLAARAQQRAIRMVGFLSAQSAELDYKDTTIPFLQGLKEAGYVEGENVAVEYRYAENQLDRLPALAADLVRRRPAVIVATAITVARAAKAATSTIPINFFAGGDPVATGLVASLNRPGANLTGIALFESEMVTRRLQLLREWIPNAARFGVLEDPNSVNTQSAIADLQAAAPMLGLQLVVVNASTDGDLEPAFSRFSQERVGAILIGTSTLLARRTEQLAGLAALHALPAMFAFREHALSGGLMSYGSSLRYGFQQLGMYTGRILNGDNPADLPVQRVTKTELVINLKTAKALGLTIPQKLLAIADEVIE